VEIEGVRVADVLTIYLDDHVDSEKSEDEMTAPASSRSDRLNSYWGGKN
jgi:hypothetical protein